MTFTIWNASARQLLNINNYLMTDDKSEFDVYENVLRDEYDGNEEQMKAEYLTSVLTELRDRGYDRDYSYLSVYTYALQGRTLEQVSNDDLSLLHNLLSRNVDDFDETTHQPRFFRTLCQISRE